MGCSSLGGPGTVSYTHLDVYKRQRLIRVESSTSRRDIVARTTAFSVVLPHSKEYNQKHGLVNIPIPDTECEIAYIYSSRRGLSALATEYIAFLKKRLSSLDSN